MSLFIINTAAISLDRNDAGLNVVIDQPFAMTALLGNSRQKKILFEVEADQLSAFSTWRDGLEDQGVVTDADEGDVAVLTAAGWQPLYREPRSRPSMTLAARRATLSGAVDQRSQELIAQGYTHDGVTLSLSDTAQVKWLGFFVARDLLTYPRDVSSIDNKDTLTVESAAEVEAIYGGMVSRVADILDRGTSLKQRIANAKTNVQLDAIVDNRS